MSAARGSHTCEIARHTDQIVQFPIFNVVYMNAGMMVLINIALSLWVYRACTEDAVFCHWHTHTQLTHTQFTHMHLK